MALEHDPTPIRCAFDIDDATFADPDARIPMSKVVGLLSRAVESTRDENLSLHLAEHAELGSFDIGLYAMISSPTRGEGYRRIGRYQRLIHKTTRVELSIDAPRAELRHVMPGGMAAPRHSAEFLATAWVRVGRVATGTDWTPTEVWFAHPAPADKREHERFFRAPIRFSMGQTTLVMPTALLESPRVRPDPALLTLLDHYALDRLRRAPRTGSLADRVRSALERGLEEGEVHAAEVATRLRLSTRTLYRDLAGEGTSFHEIRNALRKDLAARHLANPRISIAEIAFLLGFSDLSSFHRAFKRWNGRTPAEFRASLRRAGP